MRETSYIDEKEIIQKIKENDEETIEKIYISNYPAIMYFVISNNGTIQEAKDIYQDAFIIFLDKLKDPAFELYCKIKTYLYSVARRLWLLELARSNKKTPILNETANYIYQHIDEETDLEKREQRFRAMYQSLEEIGEHCKNLLTDFYIRKLSMNEITEKMGYTNTDNTKNQKYKCLKRLKTIFFSKNNL